MPVPVREVQKKNPLILSLPVSGHPSFPLKVMHKNSRGGGNGSGGGGGRAFSSNTPNSRSFWSSNSGNRAAKHIDQGLDSVPSMVDEEGTAAAEAAALPQASVSGSASIPLVGESEDSLKWRGRDRSAARQKSHLATPTNAKRWVAPPSHNSISPILPLRLATPKKEKN